MIEKERILSGWGNLPKSKSTVVTPQNDADIQNILLFDKVINRGLGRSYADQATNHDNTVIETIRLNSFIDFNEKEGILECESGVSLDDIIRIFGPKGWFPLVTPGTKYVSIGGAIANDVHGKGHHIDGSFINCVLDFRILLSDGSVVNASREENTDLFFANFGGLGLLGFILSARIKLRKIETTYFVNEAIVTKNIEELLDEIDKADKEYHYSLGWVDSLAKGKNMGRGVLTIGNHALISDLPQKLKKDPLVISKPPVLKVPFYLPSFTLNTITIKILNKIIFNIQNKDKGVCHYESFFYPLDMIDEWNKGYGKRGFIQYQFVIPVENGRKNIVKILSAITESGCKPFLNVLKKMGKGQNYLSFPMEGYTFAIDFPVTKKLREFTKIMDHMVLDAGGRIYLCKDAFVDEAIFKQMYPSHHDWLNVKMKYDPENKFSSDISRRLGLES